MDEAADVFDGRSGVLHDCVELQKEWSAEETVRCRRDLGLPENRPLVALTGQIAEVKGIWDFVEAARILASQSPEPFFVVLGDDLRTQGRMRRAMEERVESLGLTSRFRFLGFLRDAPRLVQAFDIIAVPSHVEPLGNATLEAMAAGRVVVGTKVGGIPEMVVEDKTGLLVPPSDPISLAQALWRSIRDRELWSRMSAAARQRAETAFGAQAHAQRLQASYDRLCARDVIGVDAEGELA
jgi:glycosyltransferase involved in cell wall biosynthesis